MTIPAPSGPTQAARRVGVRPLFRATVDDAELSRMVRAAAHTRVDPAALGVYAAGLAHLGSDPARWLSEASADRLGGFVGLSRDQVKGHLAKLIRAGLLTRERAPVRGPDAAGEYTVQYRTRYTLRVGATR